MNAAATAAPATDVHARDRSAPDAVPAPVTVEPGDARPMPVDLRRQAARVVALTALHWLERDGNGRHPEPAASSGTGDVSGRR